MYIKKINLSKRTVIMYLVVILSILLFLPIHWTRAAVVVLPATGGSSISADTTGGAYTLLVGPTITEGATADIKKGTIILNAPSGFIFDTSGIAPTVLLTRTSGTGFDNRNINGLFSGALIPVIRTATQLTITISATTSNKVTNSLAWQNIRVRPVSGTPLAVGNIVKTGSSIILGVTNNVTNFGTLKEVVGFKKKLAHIIQPSSSVIINSNFPVSPFIVVQDQFGNIVTSDNTTIVNYSPVLASQNCEETGASGILTSNPLNNTVVFAGWKTYVSMQYSFAEAIKICASSTGLISALSDAIIVNNPVPMITSIDPISKTAGDDTFALIIDGVNFTPSSVIYFNGAPKVTTFILSTQLSATILSSDVLTAGSFSITVTNPGPGGGTSNIKTFDVNNLINPVTQLIFDDPGDMMINTRLQYTLTRKDALGNLVTSGSTTGYLYSTSKSSNKAFYDSESNGNIITSIVIPEGFSAVNVWYFDDVLGTWTITASDNHLHPDGQVGIEDTTDTVTVSRLFHLGADLNNDGKVDADDIDVFVSYWISNNLNVDFDRDGKLNAEDIYLFIQYFSGEIL